MTPDEFTNQELFIKVGGGHELYLMDWGNKTNSHPIVFLHGGPGAGSKDKYKGNFDPKKQRVIFFDQRGAGKSLPKGSLEHNTTEDLVEDIEKIILELELDKVILTGGSWGSTLALAFAIKYPKRVEAIVIGGIYTARKSETEYLDNGGFKAFFPDLWEKYTETVPEQYRTDPSKYHYSKIYGDNADEAKRSAYAYSEFLEGPLMSLDDRFLPENYDDFDPNSMQIELHYLHNGCFMPEGYIIKNAHKLNMPVYLVQGRYDFVCPPITAYELHKELPNGSLSWTVSGHKSEHEAWNVMRTIIFQLTTN
jgi:proline iminopeptidase